MKKSISILLALVLVVACFSACSKSENANKEATNLDVKFTYDSIYSDFDESSIRAYEDLCSALVNYESEVRFNLAMLDDVLQLFYTSCPFQYLTSSVKANDDKSGVIIEYRFDEAKTADMINQFNDKIVEIEKECGLGKVNDGVYTLNAYSYVASNMKISDNQAITLFETVLNGEGSVYTYANLFEYLLLQKDIMAFHIVAEDAIGSGWSLSSAQLNGEILYFDMATEFYSNSGKDINYFAMNSKDVKAEGLKSLKYSSGGEAFNSTSKAFDACRIAKEWSLDGNILSITQFDLENNSIELK